MPHIFGILRPNRVLLLAGSVLLSLACIVLHAQGVLPLDPVTFFFVVFVSLLLSLYRPGWVFLLFIGALPLEIIDLAGTAIGGMTVRPYQFLAAVLLLAVAIRLVLKRLPFRMFRPHIIDIFPVLLAVGAFLSVLGAPVPAAALKQAVVVASFVAIYFLGRIFFRTLFDVCQAIPFMLVSGAIVLGYGLWQNIRFLGGYESFQVMTGRPNATFSEADWLGMFAVLMLGLAYGLLAHVITRFGRKTDRGIALFFLGVFLTLAFMVLIVTVARSAWLGAIASAFTFSLGYLFFHGREGIRDHFRKVVFFAVMVAFSFVLAVGAVSFFRLSPFQFFNRIQSTGSGLQQITVACENDTALPEKIGSTEELSLFGCRHIDLEAIESERATGKFVKEVYRADPNVSIRKEIYGKVWGVIGQHPFLGIGWGSAAFFLGADERGAGLNASNMFLETWLGSGLIGFLAFAAFWILLAGLLVKRSLSDAAGDERLFSLSLLSIITGLTVFNLFNSGILLGFFFVLLSIAALAIEKEHFSLSFWKS